VPRTVHHNCNSHISISSLTKPGSREYMIQSRVCNFPSNIKPNRFSTPSARATLIPISTAIASTSSGSMEVVCLAATKRTWPCWSLVMLAAHKHSLPTAASTLTLSLPVPGQDQFAPGFRKKLCAAFSHVRLFVMSSFDRPLHTKRRAVAARPVELRASCTACGSSASAEWHRELCSLIGS